MHFSVERSNTLLNADHPKSKKILNNVRRYNKVYQMRTFKSIPVVGRGYLATKM